MGPKVVHDHLLRLRSDIPVLIDALQEILGADVGGQDENRILKVHGLSHGIGDPPVVQYL